MNTAEEAMTERRYELEAALVSFLVDDIKRVLADRGAEKRHAPPWTPKQEVQVGVLRPRWALSSSQVSSDSDTEEEGEKEVPLSDPDVLGIDFVVKPSGESLHLDVDVSFALYLPELPTYAEALAIYQGERSDEDRRPGTSRKSRIPLQYAWRRYDVAVEGVTLELRPDGQMVQESSRITEVVAELTSRHYQDPAAARGFKSSFTIPVSALKSEAGYKDALQAAVDSSWEYETPAIELNAFAEPLPDGTWLVSVSLTNQTYVEEKTHLDLSVYDSKLQVKVRAGGQVVPQRFHLAPDDYRFADLAVVPGHGRGCVAVMAGERLATETLPTEKQLRMIPRGDHVPGLHWAALAEDPEPILDAVTAAMLKYADEWEIWLKAQQDPEVVNASAEDLQGFRDEISRYQAGVVAMRADRRLYEAFRLANKSFDRANQSKPYDSWRLFQLVYIVSQLPALAARTSGNSEHLAELDCVDVLWFPTGGGKTEAYLGLTLVAAFFDRLRGKDAGVTAWLKFPLRMLSVQQLSRVLRVLAVADEIRRESLEGAGQPFELGYLVGSENTPNRLRWNKKWWPGFAAAAKLLQKEPKRFDRHRLIGQCPFCLSKGDAVGLTVDVDEYRLVHECRRCERRIPLHITDDEVYRYQPTVVVSTIDKVTGFAYFGDFTSFSRGPSKQCPKHGYFAFGDCPVAAEDDANLKCTEPKSSYIDVDFVDPVPAFTIQDEMHLVREDLGVFAAHFEGLIAELQRYGPSGRPTKVLGATATIEQFHDQLRQVYGRRPRRFPSPGFLREQSFYIDTLAQTRRTFLGVMPTGSGVSKVETAAKVQRTFIETIHRFQNDPSAAAAALGQYLQVPPSSNEVQDVLFDYEVSLGFVNSKNAGAQMSDAVAQLSSRFEANGEDRIRRVVLTGEVDVPELADAIDLIEDASPSTPRSERLRALIGTSVVSHGVDLERLNLMVMAGLPSTTADYIQATSRSGRTHVGLVVTVYDHFQRREASSFSHFLSTHRLLDILVEPVPVNRYAERAVDRTLPAVVVALLWDLARDANFNGPKGGISQTRDIKAWWNAEASRLEPELEARIDRAYRSLVPGVNPGSLEDLIASRAVDRWVRIEKLRMESWDGDRLVDLFSGHVMTSLRDVDVPIEFGSGSDGRKVYQAMFPERGR